MSKYSHLSSTEREHIFILLSSGWKKKDIALHLGRNPSTITREIIRNSSLISRNCNGLSQSKKQDKRIELYHYLPDTAQAKCDKRRKQANWRPPLKRPEILRFTEEHLKIGWSPDIISGTLKNLYPDDSTMHVSHECIYQFIYTKKGEELGLKKYLLRAHKRRRKKTGRSVKKQSKIPNRVDISQRDQQHPLATFREEFGHFEGDSVLSRRKTYSALRTEVERKSRYLFVKKIPRKTAEHTALATLSIFSNLPKGAVKSTTWDNGLEHTKHESITQTLNIPIYFAEPYKSWQRGTNEHANGMLRRFFPKNTNFEQISDEEIQKVVDYLNNRPRKILNYLTPKQVFDSYLKTFG